MGLGHIPQGSAIRDETPDSVRDPMKGGARKALTHHIADIQGASGRAPMVAALLMDVSPHLDSVRRPLPPPRRTTMKAPPFMAWTNTHYREVARQSLGLSRPNCRRPRVLPLVHPSPRASGSCTWLWMRSSPPASGELFNPMGILFGQDSLQRHLDRPHPVPHRLHQLLRHLLVLLLLPLLLLRQHPTEGLQHSIDPFGRHGAVGRAVGNT